MALDDDAGAVVPEWYAAHELRTALQAVEGGLGLLLELRGTRLSAEAIEAAGLIADGARSLAANIDLLGRIARLDEMPPVPSQAVPVAALASLPELRRCLAPGPRMSSAPGHLVVRIVPADLERAIGLLNVPVGSSAATMGIELATVEAEEVTFDLACGGRGQGSGTGAIAAELTCRLLARMGARIGQDAAGRPRLGLGRALRP